LYTLKINKKSEDEPEASVSSDSSRGGLTRIMGNLNVGVAAGRSSGGTSATETTGVSGCVGESCQTQGQKKVDENAQKKPNAARKNN
jgi:hypothetical protein